MNINDAMRGYVEQAIDEKLNELHPDLGGGKFSELVKDAAVQLAWWEHPVLARALELACADLLAEKARTIPPSAADLEAFMAWQAEQKAKRAKERDDERNHNS